MRTNDDYTRGLDFSLLLIGPPLSGKTNVAMTFDLPAFIDADQKLCNAVRRFPGKKFYFDDPNLDAGGQPLNKAAKWTRVLQIGDEMLKSDAKTIVVDSLSRLSQFLEDHVLFHGKTSDGKGELVLGGEKVMSLAYWNPFKSLMSRFILTLRSECKARGKVLIFTAHEKIDKDDVTGTLVYRPLIGGQLADNIGSYFSDVWHAECTTCTPDPKSSDEGKKNGVLYRVRTAPTARMTLGNSLGLPVEFNFTSEEFNKYLRGEMK